MWFSALGTIGMREAGRPVDIGPARRRAILAVLLVHLGHPVSPDGLIDRVWVNHLRPARAVWSISPGCGERWQRPDIRCWNVRSAGTRWTSRPTWSTCVRCGCAAVGRTRPERVGHGCRAWSVLVNSSSLGGTHVSLLLTP